MNDSPSASSEGGLTADKAGVYTVGAVGLTECKPSTGWIGWTDMETGMRWFVGGCAGLTVFVLGNTPWVYEYGVIDYIPFVCVLAIGMGIPSAVRKMGR